MGYSVGYGVGYSLTYSVAKGVMNGMKHLNSRQRIHALAACLALAPLLAAAAPDAASAPASRILAPAAGAAAAGGEPGAPPAERADHGSISGLVVFGDSYSDAGGDYGSQAISAALLQPRGPLPVDTAQGQVVVPDSVHYWRGHWSNGPTAVELLAEHLGVPLLDYAVGGAMSGTGNYYGWMDTRIATGLLGQIERYRGTRQGAASDPDALYVIEVCGNDLFHAIDAQIVDDRTPPLAPARITALADAAVANIETALQRLQALGARRVLVFGSPDIALLPWAQGHNLQSLAHGPVRFTREARIFSDRVNTRLAARLPQRAAALHLQVRYFDLAGAGAAIRAAAPGNGLRKLAEACQPGGSTGVFTEPCSDPDAYFFWDEYHPTRRASELLAAALAQTLSAPSPTKAHP
jgi:phospholipase/lecithinase/hemolysin